jgi:hypothetical protein
MQYDPDTFDAADLFCALGSFLLVGLGTYLYLTW